VTGETRSALLENGVATDPRTSASRVLGTWAGPHSRERPRGSATFPCWIRSAIVRSECRGVSGRPLAGGRGKRLAGTGIAPAAGRARRL